MTFTVGAEHDGVRLDVALAVWLEVSRSQAAARIDAREVLVDGKVAVKRNKLRSGQSVEVIETAPAKPMSAPPLPPVRFEDEHVLVVAKPAGMVVHPGAGRPDGTLVDALVAAGYELAPAAGEDRPGIVHRLDRDTSGLMMVARSDEAYAALVAALQQREVHRRYVALVRGVPTPVRGRIDAPIGRHPTERTRFAVTTAGKPAVTRYRLLASAPTADDDVSLVACRLETGRTHQIRVHLTAHGHPVVGDPTYGSSRKLADELGLSRPFLHAAGLQFTHPVTGAEVAVDEPLPADLVDALAAARLALPADADVVRAEKPASDA